MSTTTTETPLASVPTVISTRRGRGRKPVARSNARECRDRITAWKLTPEEKRQPTTQAELAVELGISKQMASYHARRAPESIEELVDNAEREALGQYPGILKTLGGLAENGSVEAIKVFIRELAAPRRPEQREQNRMYADLHLNLAIQSLIAPPLESRPPNGPLSLENRLTDASKRQIPSNSDADEESTS
jgi:hypothetical protein